MKQINIPTKAGYYWAKNNHFDYYNYIVEVRGEAPFFRIKAWDLTSNGRLEEVYGYMIDEFGPEIPRPEFKKEIKE